MALNYDSSKYPRGNGQNGNSQRRNGNQNQPAPGPAKQPLTLQSIANLLFGVSSDQEKTILNGTIGIVGAAADETVDRLSDERKGWYKALCAIVAAIAGFAFGRYAAIVLFVIENVDKSGNKTYAPNLIMGAVCGFLMSVVVFFVMRSLPFGKKASR